MSCHSNFSTDSSTESCGHSEIECKKYIICEPLSTYSCDSSLCTDSSCVDSSDSCETSTCNTSNTCDTSSCETSSCNTSCETSSCNTSCDTSSCNTSTCDTSSCNTSTCDTSSCDSSNTSNCSNTSGNTCDSCTDVSEMGTISENICEDSCDCCDDIDLLPNKADVFIKSNQCVHYNSERGVNYDTPLVLGTNKLSKVAGINQVMNKAIPSLAVHGDIYVSGNIYTGHIPAELHVETKQTYVNSQNKYIDALEPVVKNGVVQNVTYHHIKPSDNAGAVYVNPINGPIYVVLGSEQGEIDFRNNQTITIKDVSLMYNEGSTYNVYVTVPSKNQIYIEHYDSTCRLKMSTNGTYIINTSNGAVTYQFAMINGKPCWIIKDQFIGNNRILPRKGLVFNTVEHNDVKKLLNYRS
jgi:hypothetical protein